MRFRFYYLICNWLVFTLSSVLGLYSIQKPRETSFPLLFWYIKVLELYSTLLILASVGFEIEREVNGALLLLYICLNSIQRLQGRNPIKPVFWHKISLCFAFLKNWLIHSIHLVCAMSVLIQYHCQVVSFSWTDFSSSSTYRLSSSSFKTEKDKGGFRFLSLNSNGIKNSVLLFLNPLHFFFFLGSVL